MKGVEVFYVVTFDRSILAAYASYSSLVMVAMLRLRITPPLS